MPDAKRKHEPAEVISQSLSDLIGTWFSLWDLPGFDQQITINFSTRLQRTLGRCYAKRHRITIAFHLEKTHPSILEEVLCHECAHLAVIELYGESCRPHGPEWMQLMRLAGFEPRRRIVLNESRVAKQSGRRRHLYIHSCPICQTQWVARRPVRSWRCAGCMALGLDGWLEIRMRPILQGTTP